MEAVLDLIVRLTSAVVELDEIIAAAAALASLNQNVRDQADSIVTKACNARTRLLAVLDRMTPRSRN